MKSDQTIIRKNLMEQLHFITNLLDIKDPNIQIIDVVNRDTHKEIIAKLDYDAPSCPDCRKQMKKYDFQKTSMTDIAHQLTISTSTVIRKLNDFRFKHDFSRLPKIMSWDEYAFTKGKMSFIAQDFDKLNIITVLEGRAQAIIRSHFLRYNRAVRCQVKIITMDMFSPYYDLAKHLFPCAKIVLDRFHIIQHLSRAMGRLRVQIMN